MGVVGSSGSTIVTGNVTSVSAMTIPATGQDLVQAYSTGGAGDTTIYTVPANKVFYVMGLVWASAAITNAVVAFAAVDKILIRFAANSTGTIASGQPIAKLVATETIHYNGSADTSLSVWGVLVDA